jgi:hypothetical protein
MQGKQPINTLLFAPQPDTFSSTLSSMGNGVYFFALVLPALFFLLLQP